MNDVICAMSGLVGGLIVGASLMWVAHGNLNPYAHWLGRERWVRPCSRPQWTRHVVVAVSWQGAVCVRRADRMDQDGHWIKKQNVSWRVSWDKPLGAYDE